MSDLMLFGVLRMPYDLAMATEEARRQFYDRAQEAIDRLEQDALLRDCLRRWMGENALNTPEERECFRKESYQALWPHVYGDAA